MDRIRPYITEKAVSLVKSNKYTLLVDYNSTKKEIEAMIIKFYGVTPISINSSKTKYLQRTKLRKVAKDRGFKKVIVELPKDKKIPGFEFENQTEKETKQVAKKVKDGKES